MAKCSKGHENPSGQAFCGACGERLTTAPNAQDATLGRPQDTAAVTPPPAGPPPPGPPRVSAHRPPTQRGNGLAVAALVLGIIGVLAGLIPLLFFIAWVLGVLAIVFGLVGRSAAKSRGAGKRQATAGFILGVAAFALGIVGVVILNNVFSDTEKKITTTGTTPRTFSAVPSTPTFPTTTAPRAKTFTVGEKVTYTGGSSIQIFSYEQPSPPARFRTVDPGMELGVLDVEFCAGTTGSVSYNSLGFKAQMADNRQYPSTYGGREPDLSSGDLPPGSGCKRGFVTLSVPAGQRPVFILWDYPSQEQARWTV